MNLGYQLRIGNKYNYFDTFESDPIEVRISNIIHDGHYFVIEFTYEYFDGIGATIYPHKLKPIK